MDSYEDESGRTGRAASEPGARDVLAEAPRGTRASGEAEAPDAAPDTIPGSAEETTPGSADGTAPAGGQGPGAGIASLSLPYQVAAAVALAAVGVFACLHLAMVFLHVAPSNTLTKQHGEAVDSWVYPEFEQNWKLFAPNPLQQNIAVQVRAQVATADGGRRTTDWLDLSGQDREAIRGNLLPSHVDQNELRRAWDFFLNSHTEDFRPNGLRGRLSEGYLRRIVMLRLDAQGLDGTVERIQLRSEVRPVPQPSWSNEKVDSKPVHRALPWWKVAAADLSAGTRDTRQDARTEASR